ncbi:MAG: zinc finger domain-containing protein [Candidatus Diapherotrites archaeon]
MKVCSTCNREVTSEFVEFKCPECGKGKIVRCQNCRVNSRLYTCKECGFTGP